MTDHHQVLIFGSFTDQEVRSLPLEPQKNDLCLTFGSFDLPTLRSVGIFDSERPSLFPVASIVPKALPASSSLERPSSRKNVAGELFQPPVALVEKNGRSIESRKRVEGAISVSSSSESHPGLEYSGPLRVGDICFGSNGFVLRGHENGNHRSETKESIFAIPNGKIVTPGNFQSETKESISTVPNGKIVTPGNFQSETKESISTVPNGKIASPGNFVPRGLVNLGNLCFLNATIQALLSCSPFLELLFKLRNHGIPQIGYPTLHAFVEFISDLDVPTESNGKKKGKSDLDVETGAPFRPVMFDEILKIFTPDIPDNLSGRPRQEDAQEFLSFVMHQMHDELLKLDGRILNGKTASLVSSTDDEDENDDGEIVGPMDKTAITRTQSFVPSKLSAIFGGQLKSVVKASGIKASATIQPFLLLHLNIYPDPVRSIEDALEQFFSPEILEEYRISAGGKAEVVNATKSVYIVELPEILVLHLMRFSYGSQGSTKLHKDVCFPLELVIGCELLASPSSKCGTYELVATITHHGRDPWKGHYTADARHPNGKWLRYDDASVTLITESKVLHDQAYVLFYRRL